MRIKGFDGNLRCRDMQYEIGKEYKTSAEHITEHDLCSCKVFHYCSSLKNVDIFYPCSDDYPNRYCEIEVLGEEVTDGTKYGSNHIKIIREITGKELDLMKGREDGNSNTGLFNNGSYNTGSCNEGYKNTGNRNLGNYNIGDQNYGSYNGGYLNHGSSNNGNYNVGNFNSGDKNNGLFNSGSKNTGNGNSGIGNLGDYNTGDFSVGNSLNGVFCIQEKRETIPFFNKDSDMTLEEWRNHPAFDIVERFFPIYISFYDKMTDVEKKAYPIENSTKSVPIARDYKEAWAIWYENLGLSEIETIKTIPNFNSDIFEKITGIKINTYENKRI